MELLFNFSEDGKSITDARLEGLTGCEHVSSVKGALSMMKVVNLAIFFSEDAYTGVYNDVSDEKYSELLDTIKCISSIWQYKDAPEGEAVQSDMNVMMLLVNAIELVSKLDARLRQQSN